MLRRSWVRAAERGPKGLKYVGGDDVRQQYDASLLWSQLIANPSLHMVEIDPCRRCHKIGKDIQVWLR